MNRLLAWACGSAIAVSLPARAGEATGVPRLLDERTVAVLRIEPGKVDLAALVDRLAPKGERDAAAVARFKKEWGDWLRAVDAAGGKQVYVAFSLADAAAGQPFVAVGLRRGADEAALTKHLRKLGELDPSIGVEKVGAALVAAPGEVRRRLRTLKPVPRPDVDKALASAAAVRLVIVPTTDAARILEETVPTLPEELGGGSVRPLTRGFRWLAADLGGKPALRLTIQATDEVAAAALDALLGRALKALAANKAVTAAAPAVGLLAAQWKPRRVRGQLQLDLDDPFVAAAVRPWAVQALEAERQTRAGANLRRLLLAMHAYEATHGTFPPAASYDRDGKPLLSWRVHLLPHLDAEKLYKEFRLDEPWDSPHNKGLIARMPDVYRPLNAKLAAEHRTTYLAPLGDATMFPGRRGVRVGEVLDGTANTIQLLDADDAHAVVWTRPEDLNVDLKNPLRGVSTRHGGKVMVGLAEGTVRFLPGTLDQETFKALLTRGGGEALP